MATYYGTAGADYLTGSSAGDLIYGYAGGDAIEGGAGADLIYGGSGNDTIVGEDGYDVINGGSGVDELYGGAGNDTFEYGGGSPEAAGALNNDYDYIHGGTGEDTIKILATSGYAWTAIMIQEMSGIEKIINNTGQSGYIYFNGDLDLSDLTQLSGIDEIHGSGANNTFIGSSFDEVVFGEGGNDILYGGGGNDTLTGGAGVDYFYFDSGQGIDTITDYTDGTDKIVLGSSITSLNVYYYNGGVDTLLELNGGTTYAILEGVDAATIDGSDIIFA